jgi:HEAT repeat protein
MAQILLLKASGGNGIMNLPTTLSKKMEAFALDLMRLIRGVRVYPENHPALLGVAERVIDLVPCESNGLLTIGVTSSELVVSGEFVSGKAASLASLLHERKVLRIFWTREMRPSDVWTFARLLSTPKMEGEELRRKLHAEGVYTIDVEPLQLDQIHGEITDGIANPQTSQEKKRRQAWMLLMNHDAPAEQIASALESEQFWVDAKSAWTDLGYGDSEGFTELLLDLGERFETALSLLPDSRREAVLNYLAKVGKSLSTKDLVRIVSQKAENPRRIGQGVASLLKEMDGERFVDLLAGLTALNDQGTQRLLSIYRHLAPSTTSEELLALVRARLSIGQDSGFATEVWKTVEDFVLKLMENPFMDSDYSGSLESLADSPPPASAEGGKPEIFHDPETYLDEVVLCLAAEGGDEWRKKLLQRIETRRAKTGALRTLRFFKLVHDAIPGLLTSRPFLIKSLFKEALHKLPGAGPCERKALIDFTLAQEPLLLDTALKALAEESRISTRYFLVHLLGSFSPAALPAFISKARNAPWYVARNLAIVLGKMGLSKTLPALRGLANHPHHKVQREALKALRNAQAPPMPLEPETLILDLPDEDNHPEAIRSTKLRPVEREVAP